MSFKDANSLSIPLDGDRQAGLCEASWSDDEGRFTTDLGPSMLAAYSQLDSAGRSHVAVFFLDAEQRGHHRLRDLEARGLSVPTGLRQLMTQISNGSYTGD